MLYSRDPVAFPPRTSDDMTFHTRLGQLLGYLHPLGRGGGQAGEGDQSPTSNLGSNVFRLSSGGAHAVDGGRVSRISVDDAPSHVAVFDDAGDLRCSPHAGHRWL